MMKNTQTSQGWSSENGSSLKELVKISSIQNESDLRAETKGWLVPPWPSVDGEGLKWWMQKLERQVWTEGRSRVWLREAAERPGAGSTSYAPHIAFLHPLQVHGPRPADWAKPTSGRIQSARSSLSVILAGTQVYVRLSAEDKYSAEHSQEILPLLAKWPFILWGGTTWLKSPLPWQRPSVKHSWQCAPDALLNGLLISITK